jgi:hypothetical protein
MSRITAQKNYLLLTAEQLEKGVPLTSEQMIFWGQQLRRIAEGESADSVLQIKRKKGEKQSDEKKRQKISQVLHLVASLHKPFLDPRIQATERQKKLSLEKAIEKVLPKVGQIMGDSHNYDLDQVKSWWYDKDKKHMQSPMRNELDPDNPYEKISHQSSR